MASSASDNIEIALEPEAAALSCRVDLSNAWVTLDKPKQLRYIVVDCGGGTVDVTVNSLDMATNKIDEIQAATGGPWGGTEVDKKIKEAIQRGIGQDVANKVDESHWLQFERNKIEEGKKLPEEGAKAIFELTAELFQAINAAGGGLRKNQPLKINGAEYRSKRNAFVFDRDLIIECYSEAINNTVKHVKGLMQRLDNIHCVLIVGGFADCPLLLQRMEEAFKTSKCRIIHPSNASLSVVKGAVMYGQNPDIVQSRVSKYTYGIDTSVPFEEGVHPEKNRFRDGDKDLCRRIFAAYVKQGDSIEIGSAITKTINAATASQKGMRLQLYRSSDRNVTYTDEAGCERLLVLRVEMPRVELGLDRAVELTMDFSRTTLQLKAVDKSSGITGNTTYNEWWRFPWTEQRSRADTSSDNVFRCWSNESLYYLIFFPIFWLSFRFGFIMFFVSMLCSVQCLLNWAWIVKKFICMLHHHSSFQDVFFSFSLQSEFLDWHFFCLLAMHARVNAGNLCKLADLKWTTLEVLILIFPLPHLQTGCKYGLHQNPHASSGPWKIPLLVTEWIPLT